MLVEEFRERKRIGCTPTESAEGQQAEIGMLVRGYSWKVRRGY